MNSDPIKVSIIMATYNRAHYIEETLKSILNQTYKYWECLIIDDGGTDNTLDVVTPILESDTRFQFFKRSNDYQKGLPGSRNFGLDKAKGDYIIFFDDDDIVHPQNLELCVNALKQSEFMFCRYIRTVFTGDFDYDFDLQKEYSKFRITISNLEAIIKNNLPFNSCAIMWKKECFEGNRFVESLMYAEEWELYTRIISQGFEGISINKVLFFGRKHAQSNTGEYYKKDEVRVQSKIQALILIIRNLKDKDLLSESIKKYFIHYSYGFYSSKLLSQVLTLMNVSPFKRGYYSLKLYRLLFLKAIGVK